MKASTGFTMVQGAIAAGGYGLAGAIDRVQARATAVKATSAALMLAGAAFLLVSIVA
jgi:hypothetical protein